MKRILLILLAVMALTSCGAYKRLAYLQDMDTETTYEVSKKPETRISRGDILGIRVLSSQPLLAAPFNIDAEAIAKDTTSYGQTSNVSVPQYTVDTKGRINFPVLGPIFVEGLTLNELSTILVDEIRATNYLKDPIVSVQFTNFKIIVLGEVGNCGIHTFPNGSVSIFELLAKVGDLNENAMRERVWVIRTMGGSRKVYALNPKTKDIFDSPAFYLQQNDMVYVAPRNGKIDAKTQTVLTWISTPLTFISTVFSGIALARSFSR